MHRLIFVMLLSFVSIFTFGGTNPPGKDLPVKFSHPNVISYDHDGFIVNGKSVFIYSGSFHYFRCDPADWKDRLEKIKAAGFNTVETYVPWNWHERSEGKPDFTELDNFLSECQQESLFVIIRPGPYICAEWNIGGFPDWLEGKSIGFRTDSPADVHWSAYWYDEVLPVIRRHLITNGGNVILMQIENEYDYFSLPDSDKIRYLKSLYDTAIRNGIDVPIITCWTHQVRDNSDSIFSQVMDACNFYPGWDISSTLPAIQRMEKEEPNSPPMITELQGGWFSSVGEKGVRRTADFGPDQIGELTDYVIAHGIKALNYYMLYGGTNFGYWGSKDKTTSYDYTAPVSEPGGLWEKYRAVKLIGDFIKMEDEHLVRAREVPDGAEADTPGIETLLQTDGSAGFLYVRNKLDKTVEAKVRFKSPHGSPVSLTVKLPPRVSYLLPVGIPLPNGSTLYYSNVPVSSITEHNGKPLIIAYGNPGDDATIYAGSSLCTEQIKDSDQLYNWDGVYVLLTTEQRAAKARVFDTPAGPISLISDSYLALANGMKGKKYNVDLETRPGADSFSLLSAGKVASVSVDGKTVKTNIEPRTGIVNFTIGTSEFNIPRVTIRKIRSINEDEAPAPTSWSTVEITGDSLEPLDETGDYSSGYTVYNGKFSLAAAGLLKVNYYSDDWHSVLIDGKMIPGLIGNNEESFSKIKIGAGEHTIVVFYENEGWPNGGNMEGHKGLKSVNFSANGDIESVDEWKYAPSASAYPSPVPTEASPAFNDKNWEETSVGHGNQTFIQQNQGWWFRTHVKLTDEAIRENSTLTFKAVDDNALVYVNGRLAAKHEGYDTPFTIPLSQFGKAGDNVVAVYVQNQGGGGGIWMPVILKWGKSEPISVNLRYHHYLAGELVNWNGVSANDEKWKTASSMSAVRTSEDITWLRGEFNLPARPGWVVPWRLHLESTGSAQIWLNGRLLGRYFSGGPQQDFYLPDGWLNGKGTNSIVLVLRPGGNGEIPPAISEAYLAPYSEYVVQKHSMTITLK